MTTQSLISGQSFGTSTNVGDGKFSIAPATLSAATTAYVINIQVTNGAGSAGANGVPQLVKVFHTTTMRTVAAADAPQKLGQTARCVEVMTAPGGGQIAIMDSSLEPKTGDNLHVWVSAPTLTVAASLSVDVIEIPS